MLHSTRVSILLGGTLVDDAAAVVIGYSVIMALLSSLRLQGSDADCERRASALFFSDAGSLLKVVAFQTWERIRLFAFVFNLRTSLKRWLPGKKPEFSGGLLPRLTTSSLVLPLHLIGAGG